MEPRTEHRSPYTRARRLAASAAICAAALFLGPPEAFAQLDPLLFLQRNQPNVIIAVDVANRMQYDANGNYFSAYDYPRTGAAWETVLGVSPGAATYRRMYQMLVRQPPLSSDMYTAELIQTLGSNSPLYSAFWSRTRLAVARAGLMAAVQDNARVARFGLLKMRQLNPRIGDRANEGPVYVTSPAQQSPTPSGANDGRWRITTTVVDAANGSIGTAAAPLVAADAVGASTAVGVYLSRAVNQSGGLIPAGMDTDTVVDAPVARLIDDARAEAARLITADTQCRNTVVILVVGGGEGNTVAGDPATRAATFLNVNGRRVPIYVIAIAPPAASVATLQAIARNSGGGYHEITKDMIEAVPPGMPVPEVTRAANAAVQHAFAAQADVNTAPTAALPLGPQTEWQMASPIVGTVNLENARDITGLTLPNTVIYTPAGTKVPQRANVMITAGMALPGFEGRLRGFRMYKPEVDPTKPYGWAFVTAGTRLWVSTLPAPDQRNIFTTLPTGQMVPLNAASAALLAPHLTSIDAAGLIQQVREQPLGAIIDSTPAMLDPPSLDPPPDPEYPGFAAAHVNRRSLIFVGANDGMMHAFDARTGLEVWAYVPFNLLPKLRALREGQPVGTFRYFVDSSAKIADVKVGGSWRTFLMFGQGPGGTFYQTLDITLTDFAAAFAPESDDTGALLSFFSNQDRIPHVWSFPALANFDSGLAPYGDIAATAPAITKTVGETWSDPAVGQVESSASEWIAVVGSGFSTRTRELAANRLGTTAGTTVYLLRMENGTLLDSRNVASDNVAETVDNCAIANDCRRMKNALQADPVATGPPNTRYISKAYIGDLDGRVWRFDLGLDTTDTPQFMSAPITLFDATNTHPIFASMASVNVGGSQDYLFFASGSDALPSNGVSQSYKLFGVLDTNGTGVQKFAVPLEAVDGIGGDEKPSTFPAVAGEIIFFSTTTFRPATPCVEPTANLYALTFLGGAAYDTNASGSVTAADSTKIRSVANGRATAPFVVDQHLVFASGGKVEILGDPRDYNNGFGQVGVRILSWRPR
jgi:outer membrane protein assembly factor BamB